MRGSQTANLTHLTPAASLHRQPQTDHINSVHNIIRKTKLKQHFSRRNMN